jgi:hypothetical protein
MEWDEWPLAIEAEWREEAKGSLGGPRGPVRSLPEELAAAAAVSESLGETRRDLMGHPRWPRRFVCRRAQDEMSCCLVVQSETGSSGSASARRGCEYPRC